MNYLVMECHTAYAVVLDSGGRFLRVANLNYEVGQTVDSVVEMKEPALAARRKRRWLPVAVAACLCVTALGAWRLMLAPFGSVRLQINPDVVAVVNRMDAVIGLDALNEDGARLIEGYAYRWKRIDDVSDELADRAVALGYLRDGGTIRLTVESGHAQWKTATENRILLELETRLDGTVTVTAGSPADGEDGTSSRQEPSGGGPRPDASLPAQSRPDGDGPDDDREDPDDDDDDDDDDIPDGESERDD